jgi:hypothetical protein
MTIITRHHYGCFTIEDKNGNQFLIQLSAKLEDVWRISQGLEPMGF